MPWCQGKGCCQEGSRAFLVGPLLQSLDYVISKTVHKHSVGIAKSCTGLLVNSKILCYVIFPVESYLKSCICIFIGCKIYERPLFLCLFLSLSSHIFLNFHPYCHSLTLTFCFQVVVAAVGSLVLIFALITFCLFESNLFTQEPQKQSGGFIRSYLRTTTWKSDRLVTGRRRWWCEWGWPFPSLSAW